MLARVLIVCLSIALPAIAGAADARRASLQTAVTSDAVPSRRRPVVRPSDDPQSWLRRNAIPIEGVDPGVSDADLQPLRQLFGESRVIALGEATHGTAEFITLKHRLIRYLVENHGVRLLLIEGLWPEFLRVNAYLINGTGDPSVLIRHENYWFHATTEMLDLLLWIRSWNINHAEDPIRIAGFDMYLPESSIGDVIAFLQVTDPSAAPAAEGRYDCFSSNIYNYSERSESERISCRKQ